MHEAESHYKEKIADLYRQQRRARDEAASTAEVARVCRIEAQKPPAPSDTPPATSTPAAGLPPKKFTFPEDHVPTTARLDDPTGLNLPFKSTDEIRTVLSVPRNAEALVKYLLRVMSYEEESSFAEDFCKLVVAPTYRSHVRWPSTKSE